MTDEALLRLAREGREEAFVELYGRYRDPLFRFAYRMTSSVDAAEDLVHDCFLSLWRRSDGFRPERGSLRMFLYGTVRNLAFKRLRAKDREELADDVPDYAVQAVQFEMIAAGETAAAVQQAVESLPPLYREVLVLADYEDLGMAEIAGIVNADIGTVKVRLHRARMQVKRQLTACLAHPAGKAESNG